MTSPPIASSEARGEEEETGPSIASSEARGEEERLVNQLPRAKQEAKKRDWSTNCLERSERLRRDLSTNCFERSDWQRRDNGQPIASSEARG